MGPLSAQCIDRNATTRGRGVGQGKGSGPLRFLRLAFETMPRISAGAVGSKRAVGAELFAPVA
jgi:hypothetical protein